MHTLSHLAATPLYELALFLFGILLVGFPVCMRSRQRKMSRPCGTSKTERRSDVQYFVTDCGKSRVHVRNHKGVMFEVWGHDDLARTFLLLQIDGEDAGDLLSVAFDEIEDVAVPLSIIARRCVRSRPRAHLTLVGNH